MRVCVRVCVRVRVHVRVRVRVRVRVLDIEDDAMIKSAISKIVRYDLPYLRW